MSTDFEEQLIAQLILDSSSIDQTGPAVFKTIFAAGRQTEFLKALTSYSARKDAEIEKVCHQHFQHFAKSIDELLGLKDEAKKLKEAVLQVLQELGRCGQLLYDTKVEMYETQKMLYNTQKTVIGLSDCLQALNVAQQATLEVMDQNFGQALRLIEQLQTQLLPKIDQFSFVIKLHQWIPVQLNTIRNFAVEELKMWLNRVREQSSSIGEIAFSRAQKRIEKWRELYEGVATPTITHLGFSASDDLRSAAAYVDLVEMEREDAASIIDNQQVKVDFAPLLRAVHLFDLMNQRAEFQSLFSEYRRAQAKVIFDLPVNLKDGEAKSFATFLHNICGFFILEYFIVRKPQKFYSPAHVEGLWETAVNMINNYVLESLGGGSDQGVFMKIKWLQVFFLHAIEVYDLYSISSMLDTILSLFYRYVDLSKTEYAQKIYTFAKSNELKPIPVSSANAIIRIKRQFSFIAEDPTMEKVAFFPFSEYIPTVYNSLSEFISNFYIFLEGVPQQSSELDDIAKKNCDWLLEEAGRAYGERLSKATFDEAVQMVRDFDCLSKICIDIARILTQKRSRTRTNPVVMVAGDVLRKAGHEAEGYLFHLVNLDMDRLLVANPYDFTPPQPPSDPSPLITGFVRFFHQTIERLKDMLPSHSIKQLTFNMFSHLSTKLTEMMYDKNVSIMNMNFINGLASDLDFVRTLAREQNDPLVLETFSEVQQLVTLMTADQVHEFLDPIVRNRKYPNLRPGEIIPVLQKIKEPLSKRRNFEDMALLLC